MTSKTCIPDLSEIIQMLPPQFNDAKKHFLQANREFLLGIRSIVEAGIEVTDRAMKEKKEKPVKKVNIK